MTVSRLAVWAVNVALFTDDERILSYNKDCSDGSGWRYDDPERPTQIVLCRDACADAQASLDGRLSVAFGCKTKVDVH